MSLKVTEIEKIARVIRKDFEERKIPREKLSKCYSQYNQEVDSNIFVAEAEKLFPKLNCGLATVYLQERLGGEVLTGMYLEHNHTFLLLGKDQIVDITADQYGGPEVYVGTFKSPWTRK